MCLTLIGKRKYSFLPSDIYRKFPLFAKIRFDPVFEMRSDPDPGKPLPDPQPWTNIVVVYHVTIVAIEHGLLKKFLPDGNSVFTFY